MSYRDTTITCRDCEKTFIFTAKQMAEIKKRGFNIPNRCPECHQNRTARRRYNRSQDVQTYPATCSKCGKDTELPFNPTSGKPVYCEECFKSQLAEEQQASKKEFVLRKPERPAIAEQTDTGSFADFNLHERLQRAITGAGYETPTPVQVATIPIGMSGRDLIGTAQTGTGKTAAFVLPILQHLLENKVDKPHTRAIVLTPTRELAEQINDCFKMLGKHTNIRSATVYGGVGMMPQERALRNGAEVIVACPGRLLDHMERGNTDFSKVEKLILDEADRMLDMGFLPAIKRILRQLPRQRHTMLFSATFAPELTDLANENLNNPQRIDVDIQAPAKTVSHVLYPCPQHLKTDLVVKMLQKIDANSVLIFTRTKQRANRVALQIEKAGYSTAALHANKSQNQRQAALDAFKSGQIQILVATDIAARGLDVETISHVINYDIPDTADAYIHRIGRTGRAEREGDAMTLVTTGDAGTIWEIEKVLGDPIERIKLDDFDYSVPAPARDPGNKTLPHRKPRPDASHGRPQHASHHEPHSSKPKPKKPKSPGYFAMQRKAKAEKSGGY